jgi:superfamily I DNA and/or RNA helicase
MATCARNVVLVGDPQQLGQVLQGTHPDGTEDSVLEHLLAGQATIPPDRGLFLERTFRLHPHVCDYISEEFYEGRLLPDTVTSGRTTPFGTGLRYLPVEHDACRQESATEAEAVAAGIARLLEAGVRPTEIKVVAAFNAQVQRLRAVLPAEVEVGTVDKFQGQEALVVFFSMASSSGEDIPRGLGFLLSRNRLNVAVSRAQALAYLACSPRLLEVDCKTIPHMRLANALCRFVELAELHG